MSEDATTHNETVRSHDATVEINRGMKGEYSVRVVARDDADDQVIERALHTLRTVERRLGIEAAWHARYDLDQDIAYGNGGHDE